MPRVIVNLDPVVEPINAPSMYENPLLCAEDVKKSFTVPQILHAPVRARKNVERVVPRYEVEEDLPSVQKLVAMPIMDKEVNRMFPQSRIRPPPPPAENVEATRFWYQRLVRTPVYSCCCNFARACCPPEPASQSDKVLQEWVASCNEWWAIVDSLMGKSASNHVPVARTWNPYDMVTACHFTYQHPSEAASVSPMVRDTPTQFPLPPPPSYDSMMEEMERCIGAEKAHHMFVSQLSRWYLGACRWSAASQQVYTWMCPPPVSARSPKQWSDVCSKWWNVTMKEMKRDKQAKPSHTPSQQQRNAKAAAAFLQAMPMSTPAPMLEMGNPSECKSLW